MTTNYKYQLRRGSKKEICPNCGKRRFVPYVLSDDNETIVNPDWGRCDRENSCGYWCKPNGNPIIETRQQDVKPETPMIVDKSILNPSNVRRAVNTLYPYAKWLVGNEAATAAWDKYHVLATPDGGCVFLQIDVNGTIRAGKIMYYAGGHRVKTGLPARWLHRDFNYKKYVHGDTLRQCFFGEHLLNEKPDAPVMVVESEKTALLMSQINRNYVWLAAGGSCNLQNDDKNKVLAGRDVTICPDNQMFIKWRQIALPRGWKVDETCLPPRDGFAAGYDILDLFEKWAIDDENEMERRLP